MFLKKKNLRTYISLKYHLVLFWLSRIFKTVYYCKRCIPWSSVNKVNPHAIKYLVISASAISLNAKTRWIIQGSSEYMFACSKENTKVSLSIVAAGESAIALHLEQFPGTIDSMPPLAATCVCNLFAIADCGGFGGSISCQQRKQQSKCAISTYNKYMSTNWAGGGCNSRVHFN